MNAATIDSKGRIEPQGAGQDGPQLRTILLTDLVDSTALVERLGDNAAAELFRAHDRLVLGLQQHWRGRLIDRSDGMLLLFERPIDGLGFALDYNRGLLELGAPHGVELKARAGLHVGEVLTWRNSEESVRVGAKPVEVEGLAKPMAGRLMTMARPGQILLSAVAEPLAHRAARELGERGQHLLWKSHGRWRFKGVPEAQQIFEVGEAGVAPLRTPPNSPKAWRDIPLWRRPAALAAEVAVVAALAIGIWFITKPQPAIAFNERDWVVLADLRNLTGEPLLDDSLEQAFRISLEQSRYVNVLSGLKTRDTLARMQLPPDSGINREIASEIAIRDGARAVILPTVAEVGGRLRISAEIIDPHSQTTVHAEYADGRGTQSALASIEQVTERLREQFGEVVASIERDSEPLPEVATGSLDALRAYALAQQATAENRWEEAERLYQSAIELDPEFALAYMGLVRLHWSSIDYTSALPFLEKAVALRDSLAPRERLYLDAWIAETSPVGTALDEWQSLASMYPDYFAGTSNASWYLIEQNRFEEALPFALAAAVPQDPFRAVPIRHIGQIRLATGDAEEALKQYRLADALFGGTPSRYTASALAVLGRHGESLAVLDSLKTRENDPSSFYVNLDRIAIALDQGDVAGAKARAAEAMAATSHLEPSHRYNFGLMNQMVSLVGGGASIEELARIAKATAHGFDASTPTTRLGDAFRLMIAVYLAQRSGDRELAATFLDEAAAKVDALDNPNARKFLALIRASQLRLEGDPEAAISMLQKQVDGQEMVQVHSALLAAYKAAGNEQQVRRQQRWLVEHRPLAFAEIGYSQLLQPLNVADVAAVPKSE